MKFRFLLLLITCFQIGFSQTKESEENKSSDSKIYNLAELEIKPAFPGGMSEFYKFISKNFNRPSDKNFKGGKLLIAFIIDVDGSITNIELVRHAGFNTADEAIRVLKKSPKWIPGEKEGKKVRVLYTLPIQLSSS